MAFWMKTQSWELELSGPAANSLTDARRAKGRGLVPDPPRGTDLHPRWGQVGWMCWFRLSHGPKYHRTTLGMCSSSALSPLLCKMQCLRSLVQCCLDANTSFGKSSPRIHGFVTDFSLDKAPPGKSQNITQNKKKKI